MKTDREMLDEAMGLLRHARPVFDSSAAVADWWDENAELWKAYLARGCSTPEPPTPEPFVTRRELGEFRRQVGDVVELTVEAIYRAVKHGPNINIGRLNSAIAVMRYGKDETGDDGERGEM